MSKALDIIKQLNIVEFDWKHNDKHDIGLIAEEVVRIIPEAVFYNSKGQIEGLKPLTLIAIIIEAIKELNEEKR
jgi:hypothetical protein